MYTHRLQNRPQNRPWAAALVAPLAVAAKSGGGDGTRARASWATERASCGGVTSNEGERGDVRPDGPGDATGGRDSASIKNVPISFSTNYVIGVEHHQSCGQKTPKPSTWSDICWVSLTLSRLLSGMRSVSSASRTITSLLRAIICRRTCMCVFILT
jgi:hypothetical protein